MRGRVHLLCLLATIGNAGVARATQDGGADDPVLSETLTSGVYALEGSFQVKAEPSLVWQVLTDYDHLSHFVPSVRTSVATVRLDGGLSVAQQFEVNVLIFSRDMRVRLSIDEEPERRIAFRDTAKHDFDLYQGSWTITKTATGSRVVYLLQARPHEAVPEFVSRGAFKDSALQMLGQLRDEIVRRSQKPPFVQANNKGASQ